MKKLRPTTQFRKDVKRYRNNAEKLAALETVLHFLRNETPIPSEFRPHTLRGNYRGCMECHIQGDFLLIWFDETSDTVQLVRLGSHSDLFG
ncbi:MAG: type II toxin-antitoxin system YafQ family toxin [Bacteroidaceae bacterium]|nr:type II toxin-antitoxin system YafQ family toxin [Bacteroidaceae bacterium]MBQ3958576.1 type II toxin-antitoxin system YafQ family toxin [Bacteroidaceae bacterium]MBQ3992290.1 type II toxin-antitoxin system YafQ family toxin [Bacteroidaceae bacterium]